MKRFAIFILLGPPLGMAAGAAMVAAMSIYSGAKVDFGPAFPKLMGMALGAVLVISCASWICDLVLAWGFARTRPWWTAAFAFFLAAYLPTPSDLFGFEGPMTLWSGIIGAVPAAVCSWLSRPKQTLAA
jgi:hypothetical protein